MPTTTAIFRGLQACLLPARCHVCQSPTSGSPCCRVCWPKLSLEHFNARCSCCFNRSAAASDHLCLDCQQSSPIFESLRFLHNYDVTTRDLILAMKYRPSRSLGFLMAAALADEFPLLFPGQFFDLIIPVPCSSHHLQRRGFNQSRLMANAIHKANKSQILELAPLLQQKNPHAQAQSARSRRQRLKRKQLFKLIKPKEVNGKNILLFDDVITTGTSIYHASLLLLEHNCGSVSVLSYACASTFYQIKALLTHFHKRV